MSLLDKIKSTTEGTASTIAAKSAEFMEAGKMKLSKVQFESEIKNKKKEIGELVYEAHKMEMEVDAERLTLLFNEIGEIEGKIEDMDKEAKE